MSKNGQVQETPAEKPKAAPARPAPKKGKARAKGRGKGRGRALGWRLLKWASVAAIWCLFIGLCFVAWLAYDLPDLSRLTNAARRASVTLVTADGQILASYGDLYGKAVKLDQLPPYLPDALLATEDRRFYAHFGIDPLGLLRAIITNVQAGHLVQGGSTITQQLAKNVFLTPDRTLRRKGQEVLLALWLEHNLTKQQILTLYLNRVYFGAGTYGVEAAARKYFGKSAAPGDALRGGDAGRHGQGAVALQPRDRSQGRDGAGQARPLQHGQCRLYHRRRRRQVRRPGHRQSADAAGGERPVLRRLGAGSGRELRQLRRPRRGGGHHHRPPGPGRGGGGGGEAPRRHRCVQECRPGGADRAIARWRGPRHGGRARLRQQPVQPRDPGAAARPAPPSSSSSISPPWRRG